MGEEEMGEQKRWSKKEKKRAKKKKREKGEKREKWKKKKSRHGWYWQGHIWILLTSISHSLCSYSPSQPLALLYSAAFAAMVLYHLCGRWTYFICCWVMHLPTLWDTYLHFNTTVNSTNINMLFLTLKTWLKITPAGLTYKACCKWKQTNFYKYRFGFFFSFYWNLRFRINRGSLGPFYQPRGKLECTSQLAVHPKSPFPPPPPISSIKRAWNFPNERRRKGISRYCIFKSIFIINSIFFYVFLPTSCTDKQQMLRLTWRKGWGRFSSKKYVVELIFFQKSTFIEQYRKAQSEMLECH